MLRTSNQWSATSGQFYYYAEALENHEHPMSSLQCLTNLKESKNHTRAWKENVTLILVECVDVCVFKQIREYKTRTKGIFFEWGSGEVAVIVCFCLCFFETGTYCVAQVDLKFPILLSQSPK
jgi:hypothetical protein